MTKPAGEYRVETVEGDDWFEPEHPVTPNGPGALISQLRAVCDKAEPMWPATMETDPADFPSRLCVPVRDVLAVLDTAPTAAGMCGHRAPTADLRLCGLPVGHAGWHRQENVGGLQPPMQWGVLAPPLVDPDSYHAGYHAALRDAPPLAVQLAHYLEVRQHTLSTAHLTGVEQLLAEARYVREEAQELHDAVVVLALAVAAGQPTEEHWRKVRCEIADVTLSDATLAMFADLTVEDCIAEKTEADRDRG